MPRVSRACRRAAVWLAVEGLLPTHSRISPHSPRRSVITALDAGVPLRDVQIAACHAVPRSTTRYYRTRNNTDRHAACVVTAFVAGAS